jgi:hypothetical protein
VNSFVSCLNLLLLLLRNEPGEMNEDDSDREEKKLGSNLEILAS